MIEYVEFDGPLAEVSVVIWTMVIIGAAVGLLAGIGHWWLKEGKRQRREATELTRIEQESGWWTYGRAAVYAILGALLFGFGAQLWLIANAHAGNGVSTSEHAAAADYREQIEDAYGIDVATPNIWGLGLVDRWGEDAAEEVEHDGATLGLLTGSEGELVTFTDPFTGLVSQARMWARVTPEGTAELLTSAGPGIEPRILVPVPSLYRSQIEPRYGYDPYAPYYDDYGYDGELGAADVPLDWFAAEGADGIQGGEQPLDNIEGEVGLSEGEGRQAEINEYGEVEITEGEGDFWWTT